MISSDFRAEARRKLDGKWKKGVLISLAYIAVFILIGFIEGLLFPEEMENFLSVVNMIIEVPIVFGTIIVFLKLYNGEDVSVFDFLKLGFSNFGRAWKISLHTLLKMIAPIILIIISYIIIVAGIVMTAGTAVLGSSSAIASFSTFTFIGFILLIISIIWAITKSYYYQLANLIAIDNTDLTAKEAITKSKELMTGKRSKLFWLQLSFIGWAILSLFTLYIGYLWLLPYMQFAIIAFYKSLTDSTAVKAEIVEDDSPIKE